MHLSYYYCQVINLHFFFIAKIFKKRETELVQLSSPLKVTCFRTSIWDETLYKVPKLCIESFHRYAKCFKGVVVHCVLVDPKHQDVGSSPSKVLSNL